ncbi:hypothetical protein Q7313_05985, partial [Shouchella rhizosphaerae]|uniref:hypothetical protein n=1 Tax=Shouchella rhizosphaerae TaxID=866786 RepID=UPI00272861A9
MESDFMSLINWDVSGNQTATIDTDNKLNNTNSLKIVASGVGSGGTGLITQSIATGILLKKGDKLTVSFYAKAPTSVVLHSEMNGGLQATDFGITTEWQ